MRRNKIISISKMVQNLELLNRFFIHYSFIRFRHLLVSIRSISVDFQNNVESVRRLT